MSIYRVHRMKEAPRETFRWAPHTSGTASAKPKDYEAGPILQALSPYAAWKMLSAAGSPLRPGDILEDLRNDVSESRLFIAKYIGFEPAVWFIPEVKIDIIPRSITEDGPISVVGNPV
jgi:hypothetical protein